MLFAAAKNHGYFEKLVVFEPPISSNPKVEQVMKLADAVEKYRKHKWDSYRSACRYTYCKIPESLISYT